MRTQAKVLAVTRQLQELCGTQTILHSAGLQLVTATNMETARRVIKALGIQAVIVCRDSWSESERDKMVAELQTLYPELAVIVRCPGCTRCHEPADVLGRVLDQTPFTQLIANPDLAKRAS
jgi:hypothetical protein